ncbi:MAG: DUF1501 domain-containing protein [Thermomicrobiales bacterium]
MPFTRRDFLKRGALFLAMGVTAPTFLTRTAQVLAEEDDACMTGPNVKRVLVVIQLGGGNDGLNNVVPYGDPLYYKARPTLAVKQSDVLPLTDYIGLNPNLTPLKALYDEGHAAIIQAVGYPNPNRSHFRSTDIWTSGRPDIVEQTGWLGRYIDNTCSGEDRPLYAVDAADTVSKLFWTGHSIVPAISSIANFDFLTDGRFPNDRNNQIETLKLLNNGTSGHDYNDYVRRAALDALDTSDQLKKVAASYRSTVQYPNTGFARGLQMIAKLINADLGTRIFHITIGGFDTHAGQSRTHGLLLKTVAEGAQAFLRDIEGFGRADDVMLMTFSEFGRRVMENGSQGTDHGTAAPLYIMGGGMNPGVFGDAPSLADLDSNGDLKFKLDFRSVYGTLVQDWLGGDTTNIIGAGSFPRIGFVRAPASTSRASDEQASRVAVAALAAK